VTLNDMLSRLDAAQQRQRRLVSDTAHELRSPIASIRAQLEVALDHPDSQEWEQTARDVLADTLRLGRLAEDLLVLARLEEQAGQAGDRGLAAARAAAPAGPGRRLPAAGTVDLTDLAGTVASYTQARVPVSAEAPGPCLVTGDAEGLRRMLVNLIDNAVRYARSQVTVAVSSGDGWALATVTDDGPGIAPEDMERAFDRFTTLDDARARSGDGTGGAGLGLAIVRATAIAHGGTAWLEDTGPGLRAAVRLPLAGAAGERPALPGGMASG
jgi:signal transduction histidine kinase